MSFCPPIQRTLSYIWSCSYEEHRLLSRRAVRIIIITWSCYCYECTRTSARTSREFPGIIALLEQPSEDCTAERDECARVASTRSKKKGEGESDVTSTIYRQHTNAMRGFASIGGQSRPTESTDNTGERGCTTAGTPRLLITTKQCAVC